MKDKVKFKGHTVETIDDGIIEINLSKKKGIYNGDFFLESKEEVADLIELLTRYLNKTGKRKPAPPPRKRVWYAHIGHEDSADDDVVRVMATNAEEAREAAREHTRGYQTVERVWPARETKKRK